MNTENNLFISYDLNSPGQNYVAVIDKIKSLGSWAKLQESHWFVTTSYSAEQALRQILLSTDRNDSLMVVDVSNQRAVWENIDPQVSSHIIKKWNN
ncbi:hypothetical protein [Pseudocolwellia agarivorans]|uniref:hypothetical protein n=1 Tax=Pseudocolwellia agarivorans TaxID=1911682 RepID=UPI003F882633